MRTAGLLAPAALPTRVVRALRRSGAGWWVAVLPAPWFLLTDVLAPVGGQPGIAGWTGVPGVALQVLLVGLGGAVFARLRRPVRARAWHSLVLYAATGALRAAVLVAFSPADGFWTDWLWLGPSRVLASMIWLTGAALVLHWTGQVRARRNELGTEFARLTRTRALDEAALAEADEELAALRVQTQAALGKIRARLGQRMTEADLREAVVLIDDLVAGLVRPTSHTLARMPDDIPAADVQPLWMRRRQIVPAVIRAWPSAAPYQPLLVATLCLPMVLVSGTVPAPHAFTPASVPGLVGLGSQVLLLAAAQWLLLPRVHRLGSRPAVVIVFSSYLVLYAAGLTALVMVGGLDTVTPLEAFLAPAIIATLSGGVAAAGLAQSREAAAARAVIRRTQWDLRRTRQRLWAQRRRLAMALHGRVQANLTAAGLLLSQAADGLASGEPLDPDAIAQVRHTLVLAAWIDQAPPSPARERLDAIGAVWAGVLDVVIELRPQAEDALEANRDAADACTAVLREILLNAVRHGGASEADVVVGLDHGSMVCLRVRERRAGPPRSGQKKSTGMGRSLIDSLALDWAERDMADGRMTVVLLAAGATPGPTDAAVRLDDVADLR